MSKPPSKHFAANLIHYRKARGWSQPEMARRLSLVGLGTPDRSTIAKIEGGHRHVTVDELVTIAYVLGVSPVELLTPRDGANLQVTPNTTFTAPYQWMMGDVPAGFRAPPKPAKGEPDVIRDVPLKPTDPAFLAEQRFYFDACPEYVWHAEHLLPGLRKLRTSASLAIAAAGKHPQYGRTLRAAGEPLPSDRERLDLALAQLKRLRDDADELIRRATRDLENGEGS